MNDYEHGRLPAGLICLLFYHTILVLAAIGFSYQIGAMMGVWGGPGPTLTAFDVVVFSLELLVLACWGTALVVASVGMVRRRSRGLLCGMICHLLLEILGVVAFLSFGYMFVATSLSTSNDERGWAPLFLIFDLMWLPLVLISGWAFLYLRGLRRSGEC